MLMFIFLTIVLALVGLAAVPLMLGVVPPNPYYGFPARSSAKNPELWTQVNRFGGRAVVVAVAVSAGASVTTRERSRSGTTSSPTLR